MRPSSLQALPARFPTRADLVAVILVFAALVVVAEASREALQPLPEAGLAAVRLSATSLPAYAVQTVVRRLAAPALSLLFTFT